MGLPAIGAYVLAGGRSLRMGQDKGLLPLAGRPLIQRAVCKLRELTDEVYILGSRPELAAFAPIVPDLRESCGPLGGIEAALTHNSREWTMILPVDMPFLPKALLRQWAKGVIEGGKVRVALFVVDEVPQPTLCLLHREVAPFITEAASQARFKLYPVLEDAARALAHRDGVSCGDTLLSSSWKETEAVALLSAFTGQGKEEVLTEGQRAAAHLWFANLNTPEEFAEAQLHLDALDD